MPRITSILFDMDGVLCDYDFDGRLKALEAAIGIPAAEIDAKIFKSGFEDAADLGQYGAPGYMEEVARLLDADVDAGTWLAARADAMTPNLEMLDLARDLKTRTDIAMFSNNGWQLREALGDIFPELTAIFGTHIYFSAEVGAGKQHTETFHPFLTQLGWSVETTLFVDDNEGYIAAARAAGVESHLFEGAEGFKTALVAHSLL
ncbi:MAG: HAD family phosphatase [Rhodospirillaceae bacterium]|nr:HAD family phosphatase [Rhodospirillaceae bacterium]MBT7512190.1 HAD family phosphatase [Rhodospirillaceae bacterium]